MAVVVVAAGRTGTGGACIRRLCLVAQKLAPIGWPRVWCDVACVLPAAIAVVVGAFGSVPVSLHKSPVVFPVDCRQNGVVGESRRQTGRERKRESTTHYA